MVSYSKFILLTFFMFIGLNGVFAVQDLMPLQGNVQNSTGGGIDGNLQVVIFDAPTGGVLVYDSLGDFDGTIVNGQYDVLLGNGTVDLSLEFGNIYYMDIAIEGEDLDFGSNERQMFQSTVGEIKRTSSSNVASGFNTLALGNSTVASNKYTIAGGDGSNASGASAIAIGKENIASGTTSIALGSYNVASGTYSTAIGYNVSSLGQNSFAIGRDNVVSGEDSFVIGRQNNVSGDRSFGSGVATIVTGNDAFAFGPSADVSGDYGVALGTYYTYVDPVSHLTSYTIASGKGSFAIQGGEAYEENSFARGKQMIVSGKDSFGINLNNESKTLSQNNTFAVVGGNAGFGEVAPQRTVHINDVMRLEPRAIAPLSPSLGDLYVDINSSELCFYNGANWTGMVAGGICS